MLTIIIHTDNAAFDQEEGGPAMEVGRILQALSARLINDGPPDKGDCYKLRDSNGNTVGNATVDGGWS